MEKLVKSKNGQWSLAKALIPTEDGFFLDDETGEITDPNANVGDRYTAPIDHKKAAPHPLTDSFSVKYSHSDPVNEQGDKVHHFDVYHGKDKVGTRKATEGNEEFHPGVEGYLKMPNIPEHFQSSDAMKRHYLANPDLWDDKDHHPIEKSVVKFNLENGLHPLHDPVRLKLENAAHEIGSKGKEAYPLRNKPETIN